MTDTIDEERRFDPALLERTGPPDDLLPDARSVADGDTDVPGTLAEVVEVERATEEEPAKSRASRIFLFRANEMPREVPLEGVPDLIRNDENMVWVDLSEYERGDLCGVADLLDLHRVGVHSALSPWQRPRLDVFGNHFYVSVTIARLDSRARRVHAAQLDLFAGHNFLVTAHKNPLPFTDDVVSRAHGNPELVDEDSAYMLYIVLDELLEHYEGTNERLQHDIEHLEERALLESSDELLKDILQIKRYVFAVNQLAAQHRRVFEAFLRPDFPFVSGESVDVYFRDLETRFSRLIDSVSAARDSVNGAFDIYVSQVAHRTNSVMKTLTIVSTVLLPTSVILGFFGTNFPTMSGLYSTAGFFVMVACILIVSSFTLWTFYRQGWFR